MLLLAKAREAFLSSRLEHTNGSVDDDPADPLFIYGTWDKR